MNNKNFANIEMVGETLVVLAAALWMTHKDFIPYVFAVGAIFTFVARLAQTHKSDSLALNRLYGLRKLASFMLLISAGLMFVKGAMYLAYNIYLFPSSWLMFFALFAAIEVYTTIRILYITKEN